MNDMTECVGLLSEMRACTASGCDTLATETETTMTLESDPTQLAAPTTDIAIIGGAVGGGVAVFCLVCVAVLVMMRSRRQRDVVHTSNNVKLAPPNTTSIYGFVPPQTQLSATTNQYSEGVLQPDSTAYATLRLSQPEGISEYVAR